MLTLICSLLLFAQQWKLLLLSPFRKYKGDKQVCSPLRRKSFIIVSALKSQRNTFFVLCLYLSASAFHQTLQLLPRRIDGSSFVLVTEQDISQMDIKHGMAFHQGSSKITYFDPADTFYSRCLCLSQCINKTKANFVHSNSKEITIISVETGSAPILSTGSDNGL